MIYNDLVLQLFANPEHAGKPKQTHAWLTKQYRDASQFQQIHFYFDKQTSGVRYLVKGNPYMIAGAEWMAQMVEKNQDCAILKDMTPNYWQALFDIPKLDKSISVSLSQAAKVLFELIQTS